MQKTIKSEIEFEGVGLHSGENTYLKLCPAEPNTGIIFKKILSNKIIDIPATIRYVWKGDYSSSLSKDGEVISTVEHLLGTVSLLGINNLNIYVRGNEIPILDGSGLPFLEGITKVGIENQPGRSRVYIIEKAFIYKEGDKFIITEPSDVFKVACRISFKNPSVKFQEYYMFMDGIITARDIVYARTFGFLDEIDELKMKGLIKGGSLQNAVVFSTDGTVINPEGLRGKDEPVKHKLLDLIGDLSLLGYRVKGNISGYKTGHSFNHAFLKSFLSSGCFRIEDND